MHNLYLIQINLSGLLKIILSVFNLITKCLQHESVITNKSHFPKSLVSSQVLLCMERTCDIQFKKRIGWALHLIKMKSNNTWIFFYHILYIVAIFSPCN